MTTDAIELAGRVPVARKHSCPFSGPVFSGKFEIAVETRDIEDEAGVKRYVQAFLASLGGIKNPFKDIPAEQLHKVSRIKKVLDRLDNKSSFGGERANAFRIIQSHLADFQMDMGGLREVHGALELSKGDKAAKAEVTVTKVSGLIEPGWRKSREWFDDLVTAVTRPLGLAVASAPWGKICVNGKGMIGTLPTALAAGTIIAKVADAALSSCYYCKTWEDNFCAGFCAELIADAAGELSAAAKAQLEQAKMWKSDFGWTTFEDGPVTPKKSDRDSAAAQAGKESAEKRKRDFEEPLSTLQRHKIRSLEWQ